MRFVMVLLIAATIGGCAWFSLCDSLKDGEIRFQSPDVTSHGPDERKTPLADCIQFRRTYTEANWNPVTEEYEPTNWEWRECAGVGRK